MVNDELKPRRIIDVVQTGTGSDVRVVLDFDVPRIALMTGNYVSGWEEIHTVKVHEMFLHKLVEQCAQFAAWDKGEKDE